MTVLPCAKINLGLNVVSLRSDGYHNIETVFFPIPLFDSLELDIQDSCTDTINDCEIILNGRVVDCRPEDNLVVKAYNLLSKDFKLPRIKVNLKKNIPMGAGLGGGSSDGAYMLRLLNDSVGLELDKHELEYYASRLGADCAFFVRSQPCYAEGIGCNLLPMPQISDKLHGYSVVVIKPDIYVSTREAYKMVIPKYPKHCCRDIINRDIVEWSDLLKNDFEEGIFMLHPMLSDIKNRLYECGALYAQMSGSGSALYGIFENTTGDMVSFFPDCEVFVMDL